MRLLAVLLPAALAVAAAQSPSPLSPAMTSLVETERAFARMAVAQGRRAAFLAFFADDSLFFTPEPANAPRLIRGWPAAGSFNLDWEPRFGDVARAGDLGYTTGPFIKTSRDGNGRIVGTGWFFTVWKKQVDATWKVLIDAGISSPPAGPLRPSPFEMARAVVPAALEAGTSLRVADRLLCDSVASKGLAGALAANSTDATRLYRDGLAPMAGVVAIRRYLTSKDDSMKCEAVKDEMSRSADLGYTYGKYASRLESGYYLRVWKQQAGVWKLAFDLLIPGA